MRIPALIAIQLLLFTLATFAQGVIVPIHPQRLLESFPTVPETWKWLSSSARNELMLSGDHVTVGIRRYHFTIEYFSQDKIVKKNIELKLIVMDVGSRVETVQDFEMQLKDCERLGSQRRKINLDSGGPGVFYFRDSGVLQFHSLFGNRLMVQIEAHSCDDKEFLQILKSIDFKLLDTLSRRMPSEKNTSSRFALHQVDEMNPQRNRTHVLGTVDISQDAQDAKPEAKRP
jgi:hypothetical protein